MLTRLVGLARCLSSPSNRRNKRGARCSAKSPRVNVCRFSWPESDEHSANPCIELETRSALLICYQYHNVKVGIPLHVSDVFSTKRSVVSCEQCAPLAARTAPPSPLRPPHAMKSKLGANNRGEAPGKGPVTLVVFLSKHTKGDIISDGLLLRFGVENALYAATLRCHHDCQDPNRQCPVDVVRYLGSRSRVRDGIDSLQ